MRSAKSACSTATARICGHMGAGSTATCSPSASSSAGARRKFRRTSSRNAGSACRASRSRRKHRERNMEFGLSEDQKLLQESIRGTLERVSPLERVRAAADKGEVEAADIGRALVELGVYGMMVPEAHGGMGMTLLDAALVAEMLGRYVVPAGFVATAVMAPIAIAGAGSKAQQEAWLPKLA